MHLLTNVDQLICNIDDTNEIKKAVNILRERAQGFTQLAMRLEYAFLKEMIKPNSIVKSSKSITGTAADNILKCLESSPMRNCEIARLTGISQVYVSIVCSKLKKQNKIHKIPGNKWNPWNLGPRQMFSDITPITTIPSEISCALL